MALHEFARAHLRMLADEVGGDLHGVERGEADAAAAQHLLQFA